LLAAEILPTEYRLAEVRASPGRPPEVVAAASWASDDPDLIDKLRTFRRGHRLAQEIRVAVWPVTTSRYVINPLTEQSRLPAPTPHLTSLKIRNAAAPLVRAGYWVSSAIPAHEAIRGVGKRLDVAGALLLALNADCGAMVLPDGAVAHFAWDVPLGRHDDTRAGLLARYQFAAAVTPRMQALLTPRCRSVIAFGGMPGLRSFVLPLVEELDEDVTVIDQPEAGLTTAAQVSTDPDAIGCLQVLLATALGLDRPQ